jgi:hypothetical protein
VAERLGRRLGNRLFPLLAALVLAAVGLAGTIWGPRYYGKTAWALPDDLWATMIAAQRLVHLNLAGLYTPPTALVSLPGTAVIMVPLVALADLAGLPLVMPHGPYPALWLLAGPYEVGVSAVALFAADALAERLGATRPRRFVLAAAGAAALWSVTVRWGHPEDAVAIGLLLYAVDSQAAQRTSRAAWLAGAAVAVQPLVLLALPVLAVPVLAGPGAVRRLSGFAIRVAALPAIALAVAVAANPAATLHAVTSQPNSPRIDHPTPWIYLAPHQAGDLVAAGPARILALVAACGCAVLAYRGLADRGLADRGLADRGLADRGLAALLWWIAVALAVRSVFEPVMVAYYLWPPLAVALIAACADWARLLRTAAVVVALTFFSQIWWRNPWAWWTPMVAGLILALYLARPAPASAETRENSAPQVLPQAGEEFVPDGAP